MEYAYLAVRSQEDVLTGALKGVRGSGGGGEAAMLRAVCGVGGVIGPGAVCGEYAEGGVWDGGGCWYGVEVPGEG